MDKIKILLIAGEVSGDILGGKLICELKKQSSKEIKLLGVGGNQMKEQGLISQFDISELSLMGFAEIIPHIPKLLRRIRQTANFIIEQKPDIVITIDSPDFCFRVMKKVNKNPISKEIKKVHFIAPSVWAYRPKRAQKIAKLYDLLLAILPFEPPYFEKYGLKTAFIGHPFTHQNNRIIRNDFRIKYDIKLNELLLCLTPGSRVGEVKRILPEMIGAVNILSDKYPNLTVAIPAISKVHDIILSKLNDFKAKVIIVEEEEKYKLYDAANFAIAKSGTNTLELAMAKLPMIVTYKANYLTYLLIKMIANIKFANLINISLNEEVIPELIQTTCTSHHLAQKIEELINDKKAQENQIKKGQIALKMMGMGSKENPSEKAAKEVLG
jgi:lipid-A-disaccharide synthase